MKSFLVLLFFGLTCLSGFCQPVINFDKNGLQLTRLTDLGNALDAHDGEIAFFDGYYYLYGTSYDCGFEWGTPTASFCGFKSYRSTDLVNWKDCGFLFDAQTAIWQKRCNGNTYGCFRPHVVYNKSTRLYVLWINVYDNVSGYRVFTGKTPQGPFTEVAEPKLAVNGSMPAGGLNNGDHDIFVDDDGQAYLAYTDWRAKGSIVIEALTSDYLSGSGKHLTGVTTGQTEAPCLFKRNDIYYVIYSDPNCGYCAGTGASYRTARSPLGPWSDGIKISNNSCGGQPSFVSTFKLPQGNLFLFGSDLWNNAAKNEALANFFWSPLEFSKAGEILPIQCDKAYWFHAKKNKDTATSIKQYATSCLIKKDTTLQAVFFANRSGILKNVQLTLFQTGHPDAGLEVEIYRAGKDDKPVGERVAAAGLSGQEIGWSPKKLCIPFSFAVKKNARYCVTIRSQLTKGCYGFVYLLQPGKNEQLKMDVEISSQGKN